MEYELTTLIDVDKTQALLTSFVRAVGIPSASIISLQGKVLVGGSWGRICRDFHHNNPQCHAKCLASDAHITNQLSQKQEIYCYQCPNGLVDAASPIFIEGEHIANFFVGQFLLEPPDVEFFRKQAAEYCFDEKAYLDALAAVPVISTEKLAPILDCLVTMAQILGEMGLNRVRELKTAEELRATEKRFEDILNFLEQIVWSTYEDSSEVLHTRAAAEQIYGRPAEQFLYDGSLRQEIVHPDDQEKFRQARAIVRELGAYEFDFRIVRPDGTIRWLNNRARLVRDPTGKPIRTDGIATDITRRKRAEEAIRDSEHRYRSIIQTTRDGFWISTLGGQIIDVNDSCCEMLGYTREEFLKMHIADVEAVETPEETAAHVKKIIEHGYDRFATRHKRKDGKIIDIEVSVTYSKEAGGQCVAFLHDITDRKQAEEERRQLEAELQHAQKLESLGVMAGGIAHDFNNLLTVIRGNADLLAEQLALKPEQETALRNIQTAANYAGAMTRALQSFSRPTQPEIRTIDANVLVRDTYNLLRRVLPAMIEFKTSFDPDICTIDADPAQIQQVLINLCVNARDAMPGGGTLSIETRLIQADELPPHAEAKHSGDRYLRIRISDTGYGMDPDTQKSMFDPFFTTKPKDLGTGLGLAIVYRIIVAHKGIVDVASQRGEGTRIDMFFPVTEPSRAVVWPDQRLEAGRRGRILVVDDEEMIASLLKTVLEGIGHVVLVATRAEDAIDLVRSSDKPFDLAIIDHYLPRQTGPECLEAIRKWHPDLKAIIISGHVLDIEQSQQADAKIISKPFSTTSIVQAVQEELEAEPGIT